MRLVRVTELSEPPVVGKRYLVPTVLHPWNHRLAPWPVFPPRHNDARFFRFPGDHFHVDPRFVAPSTWASLCHRNGFLMMSGDSAGFAKVQSMPVARHNHGRGAVEPPEPEWRPRTCWRAKVSYVFADRTEPMALKAHYAGEQAPRNRHGWVCPHQHFPLGSIGAVDGVITCPLHGLRLRVADGVCLAGY